MLVVSNIEAIQSQLKSIYTNTLSTLCPLPWLEEAEDVQYNFDDVFIPLRTIDINIQQKDGDLSRLSDSSNDDELISDLSGPSDSSNDDELISDLSGPSGSRDDQVQASKPYGQRNKQHQERKTGDLSGSSDKRHKKMKFANQLEPSGETGLHHQTRYKYDDVILLYIYFTIHRR